MKAKQERIVAVGLIVLSLAAFSFIAFQFNFIQDDAYISFRYATNYLNGHGLVYNIGERVEGYTNFLWTIWLIVGGLLGISFELLAKFLGIIGGGLSLWLVFVLVRDLARSARLSHKNLYGAIAVLLCSSFYPLVYWSLSGLETSFFAFTTLLSVVLYLRRSWSLLPVLIIGTLLRPEGFLIFGIIFIYDMISRKGLSRYLIFTGIGYLLFLAPWLGFKYYYYGALLPNTFYAKTGFSLNQIWNGLDYIGRYFWHFLGAGVFILPVLFLFRKASSPYKFVTVFSAVYLLYIILIGGDVLKVHRFFVPLAPLFIGLMVVALGSLFRKKYLWLPALGLILAWQIYIPLDYVRTYHLMETDLNDKMSRHAKQLAQIDNTEFSVAASTIGVFGYRLMGHRVIDMLGLTDTTIARHPEEPTQGLTSTWRENKYNSGYLLRCSPDYILFSTGYKPSAPAEKALFLYSEFLKCYRTIPLEIRGQLHNIYKRFYPITEPVVRDVPACLVEYFVDAANFLRKESSLNKALAFLDSAQVCNSEFYYPYIDYYKANVLRQLERFEESHLLLKDVVRKDTLIYKAYLDLYWFEYNLERYDSAFYYRRQTEKLVPWIIPSLDSVIQKGL